MSFSLANVALIRSAAQLATGVAGRVGEAIGFDEILQAPSHGPPSQASAEPSTRQAASPSELKRQLTDSVRQQLTNHSIDLNHGLKLRVQEDGSVRVDDNHPQGAKIEALLNSDAQSARLARELAKATGSPTISLDLTSSGELGNMVGPGGYPNW